MIEKIKELRSWISESSEHGKIAQIWFKYYQNKRSIEFIEQYDAEKSWNE